LKSAFFALAAVALGIALQLGDGVLTPGALGLLTAALIALVASTQVGGELDERGIAVLLAAGCAVEGLLLFTRPPGIYLEPRPGGPYPYWAGLALLLAFALLGARQEAPRWQLPLLLAVHFALGAWVLWSSPAPLIDVFTFQRDAMVHALQGHNPYAMTFEDPYGGRFPFYGEGLLRDGRVQVGYPYPPLCFALGLVAHLLAGDYRWAVLLSITLSAACIAWAQPDRAGRLAAALLLLSPRGFFVVEQGWTDPYVLLLACAVALCAVRFRRALPWMLGAFLAVKQYAVLALPLVVFIERRPWRLLRNALLFAAALTLPLALLDLRAFLDDVVLFQIRQPFRPDALSYSAALFSKTGRALPSWAPLATLAAGIWLALRSMPRAPASLAGAMALCYCAFFSVGKQAFCNYYFFVLGLAACAAALTAPSARSPGIAPS